MIAYITPKLFHMPQELLEYKPQLFLPQPNTTQFIYCCLVYSFQSHPKYQRYSISHVFLSVFNPQVQCSRIQTQTTCIPIRVYCSQLNVSIPVPKHLSSIPGIVSLQHPKTNPNCSVHLLFSSMCNPNNPNVQCCLFVLCCVYSQPTIVCARCLSKDHLATVLTSVPNCCAQPKGFACLYLSSHRVLTILALLHNTS